MEQKSLDTLEIYHLAIKIGEEIWRATEPWSFFAKNTIGKQIVRSADSMAANISEGYGRFSYKDRRLFCLYSRGSAFETETWIAKAKSRNLISEEQFDQLNTSLKEFQRKLNKFIEHLNRQIKEGK
ncbi:MAG: four helix bundle protein [Saprospiraceae bacterium]|nr:four helix bundle protein [Saprospiraceae bacterium]